MANNIVTGQQLGLFGGPLYTAYKIMGALKIAAETGGQCIYWLETNDSDFQEINHIEYINKNGEIQSHSWQLKTQGSSCGFLTVDRKLINLIKIFFKDLNQTENTAELEEIALEAYQEGRDLGEATAKLIKNLFGEYDLKLFDPRQEEFQTFCKPYLLKEADSTALGKQCNLFVMRGNLRKAVFKRKDGYFLRDNTEVDLLRCVMVPNVNTRNVVQDAYFKTDIYVAGPHESLYLSEMESQYKKHCVKPAKIKQRMSCLIIEPEVQRALLQLSITPKEVNSFEAVEFMDSFRLKNMRYDYSDLKQKAKKLRNEFINRLQQEGIDTQGVEKILFNKLKENIGGMRKADKNKNTNKIQSADYVLTHLFPLGRKQERVINLFYYMNLFGRKQFLKLIYDNYTFNDTYMVVPNG